MHYCDLNPETDTGNIIRLDNCINNIAEGIKKSEDEIAVKRSDLEMMKVDVEKPFPRAEELFKAETRLEEVHIELTKFELNDDSKEKDLYERLCDDFPEILSGKEILNKYAEEHGYLNTRFYYDDGASGTNFEREGFQQMIADIEKGEVKTVVVKDLSRFGRDHIKNVYYIEDLFPNYDVRFIDINGNLDSKISDNEFAQLRNTFNA